MSALTVFCGKGGTGRTSLSLALGLRYAIRGRSTVVVTSHPLAELAASVSLAGLKEAHPQAAENLFVIHIDPIEAVNNTVRQNIPSAVLLQAVLASSIYQSLVQVAPGFKEIAFMNRLYRLSEDRSENGRTFEHVVWDAPATGHFLQMLRVARNFESWLSGPFALLGARIAKFSADPSRFGVLPVTTLEEMAAQETVEMCAQLRTELGIATKTVICNMTSPLVKSAAPAENLLGELRGRTADVKFIVERSEIERSIYLKLRRSLTSDLHVVGRTPSWATGLDLLRDLARQLENLPESSS